MDTRVERAGCDHAAINVIPVSGACTVRLEMPLDMQSALIFHYNLKFYNNDTDNYEGVSLKRFVMQVSIEVSDM